MQQYRSIMSVIFLIAIGLTCQFHSTEASAGVKDFGDSCNILSSGVQFLDTLGGGERNYKGACDVEKGLVCVGTCTCIPGQEFQQNIFEKITGGGKCTNGASTTTVTLSAATFLAVIPILAVFMA